MHTQTRNATRMPVWIRQNLGRERHYPGTAEAVHGRGLNTVCEEARCPNRGECWSRGTATFMLLGETCTRACAFCAVKTGRPTWADADEPRRVAESCIDLGLNFVVLTSVNRDDLPDGGAGCFADTLRELRLRKPNMGVEFLTPDFRLAQQAAAGRFNATLAGLPDNARKDLIWGHNMETVPRLYKEARKGAKYERSLDLLALAARQPNMEAKSALMLGLGETREEVLAVLADLRAAGVRRLSLGQYLRPGLGRKPFAGLPQERLASPPGGQPGPEGEAGGRLFLPVARYVPPEEFAEYETAAREMGFTWVKAGPLVRSSYYAEEVQSDRHAGAGRHPENHTEALDSGVRRNDG